MSDDRLTTADKQRLREIADTTDPAILADRLFTYYHDANRADRTSRGSMYLHLGMLAGAVMSLADRRRVSALSALRRTTKKR